MGKVFSKNISKLTFCILFTCILISGGRAHASYREFQLFDRAYLSYLSYQPEKAVEEFRLFLREFPDSSAKDAALFWFAKSLLQIKSMEEAKKIFADIKEHYPESPFNRYVAKEMETIGNLIDEQNSVNVLGDAQAGQKLFDADKPQKIYDAEREKTDVLQRRLREHEQREKYIINSAVVLDRLGIHDVLWRTSNIFQDIESEQILYEQATSLNITADSTQQRELIGMYKLDKEQADYLNRYLVICEFLTAKMNDIADEKIVESLTVKYKKLIYKEDGTFDTLMLASELQTYARNGMSLEDIHALYPDATKFASVRVQDMEAGMKEKISSFQNGETGVFWTEDGFMIVRLIYQNIMPCNPVEYKQSQARNRIRIFISELLEERKREENAATMQKGK